MVDESNLHRPFGQSVMRDGSMLILMRGTMFRRGWQLDFT
jgi:hypothetical protein